MYKKTIKYLQFYLIYKTNRITFINLELLTKATRYPIKNEFYCLTENIIAE